MIPAGNLKLAWNHFLGYLGINEPRFFGLKLLGTSPSLHHRLPFLGIFTLEHIIQNQALAIDGVWAMAPQTSLLSW
jgi:hypothetical protein